MDVCSFMFTTNDWIYYTLISLFRLNSFIYTKKSKHNNLSK